MGGRFDPAPRLGLLMGHSGDGGVRKGRRKGNTLSGVTFHTKIPPCSRRCAMGNVWGPSLSIVLPLGLSRICMPRKRSCSQYCMALTLLRCVTGFPASTGVPEAFEGMRLQHLPTRAEFINYARSRLASSPSLEEVAGRAYARLPFCAGTYLATARPIRSELRELPK